MDADIHNPSLVNRFCVDELHKTNIAEWNKKRKLQSDQLDLLRPKHKCWIGNSSSEHALMLDENPVLESMHFSVLKGRTDATLNDNRSEPESAKDSNSFMEDSNTAMSVNEEVEKMCSSEEGAYVEKECDPSYHFADFHTLKNLEAQLMELASGTDHKYSKYAKDSIEECDETEFEDILYSKGENHNMYVLSSGRWNVNEEAQSSARPPTIDKEFEDYFSMLML